MAATLTKIAGPVYAGPGLKMAVYQCLLDNSYPTGGEGIDLTGEFDYVYAISIGGNDATADNLYKFDAVLPSATTATSSTNTLIQATWDPADAGAAEDFVEVTNTTDLSSVGQLSLVVFGA